MALATRATRLNGDTQAISTFYKCASCFDRSNIESSPWLHSTRASLVSQRFPPPITAHHKLASLTEQITSHRNFSHDTCQGYHSLPISPAIHCSKHLQATTKSLIATAIAHRFPTSFCTHVVHISQGAPESNHRTHQADNDI